MYLLLGGMQAIGSTPAGIDSHQKKARVASTALVLTPLQPVCRRRQEASGVTVVKLCFTKRFPIKMRKRVSTQIKYLYIPLH